jgi:hypothetical protein
MLSYINHLLSLAPGQPPSPTKAYNVSSTSIQVNWGKVDKHYTHGVLLGYKVFLCELFRPVVTTNKTLAIQSNTTLFIGLKIYTKYVIKVLAFNKHGDGKYDMVITATDQDGKIVVSNIFKKSLLVVFSCCTLK